MIIFFDTTFTEIPEQDNPVYNNAECFVICKSYSFECGIPGVSTYTLLECFTNEPFNKIGIFHQKEVAENVAGALLLQKDICKLWGERDTNTIEDHELVQNIEHYLNKR